MSSKTKTHWINIRSSSYIDIDTSVTSKDDSLTDIEQLINCSVCLNIIFDKNNLFKCPQCLQNTCLECKCKIETQNSQFICPLCRHTIEGKNKPDTYFIQNVLLRSLLKYCTILFALMLIVALYVYITYYSN